MSESGYNATVLKYRKTVQIDRHKNKLFVQKYFKIENNRAACRLCAQTLKSDRTFNLKTHVRKVHNIDFFKNNYRSSDKLTPQQDKTPKMPTVKVEIEKKKLIRAYLGLIIDEGMPFNILDSENLKNIIDPICCGLSAKNKEDFTLTGDKCRYTFKLVADNVRKDLKWELKEKFLSLKVDTIATRGLLSNFIAISALYIDDEEIQFCILGVEELEHESNLPLKINNILNKYELNSSQVISITWDRNYSLRDHEKKIVTSKIILNDIEIQSYASQIAHDCVLSVMRECRELKTFLECCRNFVKYIRNPSNNYMEIFNENNLEVPQLDCDTQWFTTYRMIKNLKQAKDVLVDIHPIKNEFQKESFKLVDNFWDVTEAYCIACEPLQKALDKFQHEQLHSGNFYAEWLKCKIYTEKIVVENSDKPHLIDIATNVLEGVEFATSLLLKNDNFISCLYLDPRFKHTLNDEQKQKAILQLNKLYEKVKGAIGFATLENDEVKPITPVSTEADSFNELADELLHEYLTKKFKPTTSDNYNVFAKIEQLQLPFQRVDTNIILFWKQKENDLPEIYKLSNLCFAVPASQVSMEQYFSSIAPVVDKQSGCIDKDLFENILLVKYNATYLNQAIDDLLLFDCNYKIQ